METSHADLLTILRATPVTLDGLLRGVSEARTNQPGPSEDDAWSIAAIVCHLVTAEEAWLVRRVRLMAEQDNPFLPYYDDPDYTRPPALSESLTDFRQRRAESTAYIESLTDQAWSRPGQHVYQGPITIGWTISHIAAHDAEHLVQIARRLT
jgi:uncharacterized damage-inducible protein DinB